MDGVTVLDADVRRWSGGRMCWATSWKPSQRVFVERVDCDHDGRNLGGHGVPTSDQILHKLELPLAEAETVRRSVCTSVATALSRAGYRGRTSITSRAPERGVVF